MMLSRSHSGNSAVSAEKTHTHLIPSAERNASCGWSDLIRELGHALRSPRPPSGWLLAAIVFIAAQSFASGALAQKEQWVGTWGAAPLHPDLRDDPRGVAFITRPDISAPGLTIREIVRVSLGGATLRVRFSNLDGDVPLEIGKATVAHTAEGAAVQPGSDRPLSFNGRPSVSIPPGALAVSDPVTFAVPALAQLTVTIYLPTRSGRVTEHQLASATSYHVAGDQVANLGFDSPEKVTTWEYLNGIDVLAPEKDGAIVTIGDSITDGAYSTPNADARWPDELARRLQNDKRYSRLSVINESISGNKILQDRAGPNALARFDRDVLAQSGVKYLIVLEGINDIGHIKTNPEDQTSADDIILALDQMILRAHTHGIAVIGGTLTPYRGAGYYSEKGEAIRTAVNTWIRTSGAFDGVIDFEATVKDPQHPDTFSPAYEHGDHLHPNDAGYKAMGNAINLKLFTVKPHKP